MNTRPPSTPLQGFCLSSLVYTNRDPQNTTQTLQHLEKYRASGDSHPALQSHLIVSATAVKTNWVCGPRSEGLPSQSQGSHWSRLGKDVFSPSLIFWAQREKLIHSESPSQFKKKKKSGGDIIATGSGASKFRAVDVY